MRNAGELREKVTLLRRVAQTQGGVSQDKWEVIAQVRATVYYGSDKEFVASGASWTQANTVFTIRRISGLDSGARLCHSGRVYEVVSVQPTQARGFLRVRATALAIEGYGHA